MPNSALFTAISLSEAPCLPSNLLFPSMLQPFSCTRKPRLTVPCLFFLYTHPPDLLKSPPFPLLMSFSPGLKTRFLHRTAECSICSAAISVQGQLNSCKHLFCLACILQWGEIENTCPICKRRFTKVTPRWHRKCLSLRKAERKVCYLIDRKSQQEAADAGVGYEGEQQTGRDTTGWRPSLLSYLEDLISEIRR